MSAYYNKYYMGETARYVYLVAALLICICSCKKDNGDLVRFSELGAVTKEYIIDAEAGKVDVEVYASDPFKVHTDSSYGWIHLDSVASVGGDTSFTVRYDANPGLPRMGKIVVYAPKSDRRDTVVIKQHGTVQPELTFAKSNISILGKHDSTISVILNTTIAAAEIKDSIVYTDSLGSWVANKFELQKDSVFSFKVKANPSETKLRNAQVRLSYTDGWGEEHVTTLHILQSNALNQFGEKATFTDIRAWAGDEISSDLFIEGYIVSNKASQNTGDNLRTTTTAIDYSVDKKTVYIESVDGQYGFKLETAEEADNNFTQYSKVQILLKGTRVTLEPNPDRYSIEGITAAMVMSEVKGTAGVLPDKHKNMAQLTDDDIYTYVTLTNCEFPIRKGSLTPINEGYSALFNANRLAKYPLLMRGQGGNSMFVLTNTTCPYRRDGSVLPYGSGSVSGVIVHETYTGFAYEDAASENDYGNIGRYQIRHTRKTDINLAADQTNGFSRLLTEYQFPSITDGVAYPTYGDNGWIRSSSGVAVATANDYSYLGPCGSDQKGNNNQYGTGVLNPDGSKQNTASGTNSDGKGAASASALGINCKWWNDEKNRGEAWIVNLSTEGISTDQLSLQFTALNSASAGAGTPRYWRVDWSESDDMDGQWHTVGYYTVPDVSNYSNTLMHQLPAYKNINIPLPIEMLGKKQVYIRLIVDKNLCSNGNTYATEPITKSLKSYIGYLAVRYNK